MWPVLVPGAIYWASVLVGPREGNIVVCRDPRYKKRFMVKRIEAVGKNGYWLKSEVSWGSSSKDFGIVSPDAIMGTVISSMPLAHGRKNQTGN